MPLLTVQLEDQDRRVLFESGSSVRDILDETDIRVRAACNGTGACGLCRIRITEGDAGEPAAIELASLGNGLLDKGVRLACQVTADNNLRIEIINPAPPSVWHSLDAGVGTAPLTEGSPLFTQAEPTLGLTVDLGTTHISITVVEISTGRRLAGRRALNPQAASGADVLTRLMAAQSADQAEKLSLQAVRAIEEGVRDIGSREGIDLMRVVRVVLVGNTAMVALLSGQNHHLLLQPSYWAENIDCLPVETNLWRDAWGINPEAVIEVIPPLAGFVGSDLLTGVIATRLTEQEPGALLIDFGTNSEVALWDGNKLWVSSAAGGPAFEGCAISCGVPAEPGAIWRVAVSEATEELTFHVIADAEARGLCGSGLVDLLACLVRNGTLNRKGQFVLESPVNGFHFCSGRREFVLTRRDIDIFQRAKAAIGVVIEVLLAKAGMRRHELRRICIGGIFGQFLNVANAQEIGLLPPLPAELIETAGNTALSGCEALILSAEAYERLLVIREHAHIVNLSNCPDFETLFLDHLYLQPNAVV
ncbi:MAG TPA: ASKHA domain-containing protein [Dongiaceae bacterium]|nr:ASKHA domain-containing protein [Dongiaceae bacterium]